MIRTRIQTALALLGGKLACLTGGHDWTSMAMENPGVVPRRLHPEKGDTSEQIRAKFREYARMYCRRCRRVSKLTS